LETKLGRKLEKGEDAEHIDGDKENNSPANLRPMEHVEHIGHSNRNRTTQRLRKALAMVKKGEKIY
jgi:hypothetical protein